ncbi:cell envelope-related transcriptional attenuator [Paenibacillus curdlanolyticus YK9]|uniref:Cell envelope-related transcriptional attenuator n=1 Tax=Paenibacillus curdlanolyticus YK9 TaxID=717606 RepID=E0I799_9BACL|nr:LCP family protein [Paenibacillus curdlanolyticus]EFM11915.1 cell envelope-related transcriptional attenuator [Paenibacillus curdlanolyticus YK9]
MKTSRKKRILTIISISLGVLIILAAGIAWYAYHSVKSTADDMYEPVVKPTYVSTDKDVPKKPADTSNKDPFTVLVLGVDERKNDAGRSDTMIVLSVNPQKHDLLMFNIPRDTRTQIVGHGTVDKINHAYAFGGVSMSLQTVEQFLDYPIDYYVKVNMEGFARIVDVLGGVEVNNPFSFDYIGHHFEQGPLSLNGEEALAFSRMRYDDPRGDLGRNARQRSIVQSIMKDALKFTNLTKANDLLSELGQQVKTNVTFSDMKRFVTDYQSHIEKIETIEIAGSGQRINGIWYLLVADAEKARVHQLLKDHQLQVPKASAGAVAANDGF